MSVRADAVPEPQRGGAGTASDAVVALSLEQSEAWAKRERPEIEEVAPGIFAIPVPVRGPIRYVYSYLIHRGTESILIDPGEDSEVAWSVLTNAFSQLGFDMSHLAGIVVTHYHYDHWEGADRLAAATGAWLALGVHEWEWVSRLDPEASSGEGMLRWYQSLGVEGESAQALVDTVDIRGTQKYQRPTKLLKGGDRLPISGEHIEVLFTPGHTPGHVTLFDHHRKLFFSGDHVLPTITPHLALNRFGAADPLAQYLSSLWFCEGLGDVTVLPAHEYRFSGLGQRIRELRSDVDSRTAAVRELLRADGSASVWEIAQSLQWSRPWQGFGAQQQRMAVDETAAHMVHLRASSVALLPR